ncbi:hypothetical protein [Lactobacillus brevis] [Lactiplantibacillus mudanjiangensis]|uniref:hypothetical protein n=1 Tax=Lactiplantibacillus mudanjiangensis TaxID=1296538 RepID=UPI00101570C6|nr:hypothetical protein [Lactiplantibacillus mudanjiangensis]VDG31622.1 hypothetical protein [Lactobacillus brevis] [Lactiplantibacillus mudanjiangensis]
MSKRMFLILAVVTGIMSAGCSTSKQNNNVKASSTTHSSSNVVENINPLVGKTLSTEKGNLDVAYRMANKKVKFYRNLKEFGKKSGQISEYETEKGHTFGIAEKYTTEKGTYYRLVLYQSNGLNNSRYPSNSDFIKFWGDSGYVKASDMKRFKPITSEWTYQKKQPYYIAKPYGHRIWNRPSYTVHYTYINHVLDRLTTTQLYATKEAIKYNGSHYIYLETAKGRKLGWIYKSPKVLVSGKYQNISKRLLNLRNGETKKSHIQSKKSTGNRVSRNGSASLQQRAYIVRNKKHQIVRVLVIGNDNRPTKIMFKHGQSTQLINYSYFGKPWKTITNKKKLRTHYTADNIYNNDAYTETKFYSTKSKKLVQVMTVGIDANATTTIYRNGRVKFATNMPKDLNTYPISDFD